MDIAKSVFEAIDGAYNKRQNDAFVFENAENVIATKDVLYSDTNIKDCLLDYYYVPRKKGKYPVILNIHGGGFVAGGKEYRKQLCTWFALEGYFVVNVNYGLSPDCNFPEPIKQLVLAENWIYRNRDYLKLDISKVVVCGDSSGAYYASMLAVISNSQKLKTCFGVSPKLKFSACILNCGLYDIFKCLETRTILDLNIKIFESYTGIKTSEFENYEFKDCIAPIAFVDENFPPTFLIYAEKDIFCRGQSEMLVEALDKFDVYYESYHTVSLFQNHCFSLTWTSDEAKEANLLLYNFLDKFKDGKIPKKQSESKIKIRQHEKRRKHTVNQ